MNDRFMGRETCGEDSPCSSEHDTPLVETHSPDRAVETAFAGGRAATWALRHVTIVQAELPRTEASPFSHGYFGAGGWLVLKLVDEGSVLIEAADLVHRIESGGLIVLDSSQHFFESVSHRASMRMWRIPKDLMADRGSRVPLSQAPMVPNMRAPGMAAVRDLMRVNADHSRAAGQGMRDVLEAHLLDLFELVMASQHRTIKPEAEDALVFRARSFIERSFGSAGLGVDDVAGAMNVSVRRLRHLFLARGLSVMGYVLTVRLAHAQALLSATPSTVVSVQDVAWQSGFTSAAQLRHAFKKVYGMTPTASRVL